MIKTKKMKGLVLGLFAAGLFASPGCKKAEHPLPPPPGTTQLFGVNMDVVKFEQEFQNASPELQAVVQQIKKQCRVGQVERAGAALEKLGTEPGLTESQKKAVSDLFAQVDRALAKKAALRGQ
jgi:hypothetical protein